MAFNQQKYIDNYNRHNYKMYQFRIRKSDESLIEYLDNLNNKNSYIVSLIEKDIHHSIYTIKQIKDIIIPILKKYGIII